MARRISSPTKKRERSLKEGRGIGHGRHYKPFLQVQEVPSHGRSTRIKGSAAAGRTHELLSDNERSVLLSLDHAIGVEDIREQVPLNLETTIEIAARAGIEHPRVKDELADLTTDIVADIATSDGPMESAIAVKSAADLCNKRVIEKLEIERRYWLARGVPWQISTDREIELDRKKHDLWLHGWQTLDELEEPSPGYWMKLKELLIKELTIAASRPISDLLQEFDGNNAHKKGHCLAIIRHCLAAKEIRLHGCHYIDLKGNTDQLKIVVFD